MEQKQAAADLKSFVPLNKNGTNSIAAHFLQDYLLLCSAASLHTQVADRPGEGNDLTTRLRRV